MKCDFLLCVSVFFIVYLHQNKKATMIQVFQVQNFFSIREKQTLTFLPAKYNKMRSQ